MNRSDDLVRAAARWKARGRVWHASRRMKIAATGITSGVGRRLCEIARERGDEVVGIARDPSKLDARALARIGVRVVGGDVCDATALTRILRSASALPSERVNATIAPFVAA
jgi:nucleoside-diphosphate-sugar epimerase